MFPFTRVPFGVPIFSPQPYDTKRKISIAYAQFVGFKEDFRGGMVKRGGLGERGWSLRKWEKMASLCSLTLR